MGQTSAIEWTDASWNPWQGCTKISDGCKFCYMFDGMARYGKDGSLVRRSAPPTFRLPLRRHRDGSYLIPPGAKCFTCSWSDWFHDAADAWRPEAWDIIRARPDVTFQIVTKRPERIADCLPADWGSGYKNVWLIITAESQKWLDVRIGHLLKVPAVVRGLSCEPLLGPIDLKLGQSEGDPTEAEPFRERADLLHWVIVGGESGHHARPMHPEWARGIRDQCQAAGVAFFFKQWGEFVPGVHETARGFQDGWIAPDGEFVHYAGGVESGAAEATRVGKKKAGRLLDGVEWSQFPTVEKLNRKESECLC